MNNKTMQITIVMAAFALFTTACSSLVEATYGDAVRGNVSAQVYDPATVTNPSRDIVEGTDGQRMEGVMENHRGNTGSAESVSTPIVINVGN